jgi:hypothetical protein
MQAADQRTASEGTSSFPGAALNVKWKEYSNYNSWAVASCCDVQSEIWPQSAIISTWIIRNVYKCLELTIIFARVMVTSSIFGCWSHVNQRLNPLIVTNLSDRARM